MCRQGGYYEQAAYLAKQHGENDMVVDILIEDSKQYNDALNYIWHLDPEAVRLNFIPTCQMQTSDGSRPTLAL